MFIYINGTLDTSKSKSNAQYRAMQYFYKPSDCKAPYLAWVVIPGGWSGGSIVPFMFGTDNNSLAFESCQKESQL